ncbi:hypothetical protein GCM10027432_20560 [Lysobacter fragariae]
MLSWLDAVMAASAQTFIDRWGRLELLYKRPLSQFAYRLRFAFYPLLAIGAIAWLGWDWTHDRSLNSAEDAIFDTVIKRRPVEPIASKRVVVVEIDDCSIDHFRNLGEGGWPWSRQRHADLLDALDRAGVSAAGFDIMFTDPSSDDPIGDATLEAMAEGGGGRFVFGASRVHADFDASAGAIPASTAPGAFALAAGADKHKPRIALLLPYGKAMTQHAGLLDVTRSVDGVLRDIPLRSNEGDWAIPSMALRLAAFDTKRAASSFPASVRINWRSHERIAYISAADLIEGKPVCLDKGGKAPSLKGRVALIGYTASGLNDAKPTPVDPVMPGVEVQAEATAALIDGSAIWMPPASLKYVLAGILVLLTAFAFHRGEPAGDIDSIFVAINLLLLSLAYAGLTFFGVFFDIFASIGFVSLCFGLCRTYAGVQRGRAVGIADFLPEFQPQTDRWLVLVRLRFIPYPSLDKAAASRRRREYRRRLRRFLYAGTNAVMMEGVVERKSWLHATLDDLMLMVWKGPDEATARQLAQHDLDALHVHLNEYDDRLDDDGMVKASLVTAEIDDDADESDRGERLRLREAFGRVLEQREEWPLSAKNCVFQVDTPGDPQCTEPSAS